MDARQVTQLGVARPDLARLPDLRIERLMFDPRRFTVDVKDRQVNIHPETGAMP